MLSNLATHSLFPYNTAVMSNSTIGRNKEKVRLKRKKGRSNSSARWLQRQLNDPYVNEAQRLGYRSRAAFKIIELNDKFDFIRKGMKVLDLGAAPGGWSQVVAQMIDAGKKNGGTVVAIDILPMESITDVITLEGDIYDENIDALLMEKLGGPPDLVMSDMAANTTGHSKTDHIRTIALAEAAADVAVSNLTEGGAFVAKVFQGGANKELMDVLKKHFKTVKHFKPPSSRKGSPETYVVAVGFRKGV